MANRSYRGPVVLVWISVGLALAGCSGQQSQSGVEGPTNQQLVKDVGEWVKAYAKDHNKAPTGPNDIAAYEPTYPDAHQAITTKAVIYQWGAGLRSGGDAANTVLAYEKDTATKGGWVLMQDGTVKEMTADVFKAAPKAKK